MSFLKPHTYRATVNFPRGFEGVAIVSVVEKLILGQFAADVSGHPMDRLSANGWTKFVPLSSPCRFILHTLEVARCLVISSLEVS